LKAQEKLIGSPSPRTPKPSIRELVKKYDAENRFENDNDHAIKEMELEFERKYKALKNSSLALTRDSVCLIKAQSRNFIKKTTANLTKAIQNESMTF
jgi:hypothetical protein